MPPSDIYYKTFKYKYLRLILYSQHILIGEVKWKTITKEDIERFKESVKDFYCRKVLICKKGIKDNQIETIDAEGLLRL